MEIPVDQPHAPVHQGDSEVGQWSTELDDYSFDFPLFCLTFWFPCITFGRIAEIVDRGSPSCGVSGTIYGMLLILARLHWLYSCFYHSKMKQQFGIPPSCLADCCIHLWCEPCALCQMYIEVQNRGFDPALGWHGNIERQNRGVAMTNPPIKQNVMTR